MKKLLCLFLCTIMLLSVLAGCAKETPDSGNNGSSDTSDSQAGGDSVSSDVVRKEMTFENFSVNDTPRDFVMMVRGNRYHYLWQDEDSTNRVKSATYKRNRFIEENFGIKFVKKEVNGDKSATWVTNLSATDASVDLAVPDHWWLLEYQDLFINLYDRTELQFDQPYWYDGYNVNNTINNKLYTVAGDATLEIWENIEVVFFNKTMAGERNLYKMVDDNEWTIDNMLAIAKEVAVGLDDSDDSNDVYGSLFDAHSLRSIIASAGIKLVDVSNGTIEIIAQSRTLNLDIAAKVNTLLHDNTTVSKLGSVNALSSTARSDIDKKVQMFNSNGVMFYATALYLAQYINNVQNPVTFGILPMPKYAEEDDYVTTAYGLSPFAIPKIAADPHFSAVILDALNYYSEDYTLNAFYEQSLKGQLADGSDDVRMLDLAKETMFFDFGFCINGYKSAFKVFSAFETALKNNTEVQLTSPMSTSTACLAELIAFYSK